MDDGGFQTFCVETEDHKTHAFCLENAHMVCLQVGARKTYAFRLEMDDEGIQTLCSENECKRTDAFCLEFDHRVCLQSDDMTSACLETDHTHRN